MPSQHHSDATQDSIGLGLLVLSSDSEMASVALLHGLIYVTKHLGVELCPIYAWCAGPALLQPRQIKPSDSQDTSTHQLVAGFMTQTCTSQNMTCKQSQGVALQVMVHCLQQWLVE